MRDSLGKSCWIVWLDKKRVLDDCWFVLKVVPRALSDDEGTERPRKKSKKSSSDLGPMDLPGHVECLMTLCRLVIMVVSFPNH